MIFSYDSLSDGLNVVSNLESSDSARDIKSPSLVRGDFGHFVFVSNWRKFWFEVWINIIMDKMKHWAMDVFFFMLNFIIILYLITIFYNET